MLGFGSILVNRWLYLLIFSKGIVTIRVSDHLSGRGRGLGRSAFNTAFFGCLVFVAIIKESEKGLSVPWLFSFDFLSACIPEYSKCAFAVCFGFFVSNSAVVIISCFTDK